MLSTQPTGASPQPKPFAIGSAYRRPLSEAASTQKTRKTLPSAAKASNASHKERPEPAETPHWGAIE